MPEARDRRSTTVDIAALFARRRALLHGVLLDDELDSSVFGSARRQPVMTTAGSGLARGGFGTPRTGAIGAPAGAENNSPSRSGGRRVVGRSRGRGRGITGFVNQKKFGGDTPYRCVAYPTFFHRGNSRIPRRKSNDSVQFYFDIKTSSDSQPKDWDEREYIEDPDDVKPEGYDSIPAEIPDPNAKEIEKEAFEEAEKVRKAKKEEEAQIAREEGERHRRERGHDQRY